MREFGVNFVGEIAEVDLSLVIDSLEEHNGGEILFKILNFVRRHFSLKNVNDIFFFAGHYFLG